VLLPGFSELLVSNSLDQNEAPRYLRLIRKQPVWLSHYGITCTLGIRQCWCCLFGTIDFVNFLSFDVIYCSTCTCISIPFNDLTLLVCFL